MYSIGHHLLSANAGGSANRHVLAPCLPPGEPRSTIILYQKSPIFASGYKKMTKEKALVGLF